MENTPSRFADCHTSMATQRASVPTKHFQRTIAPAQTTYQAMTNKTKSKRTKEAKEAQEKKRQALKGQATKDVNSTETPSVTDAPFGKGQLNALLLLLVGVAKLMNLGKAIRVGDEPSSMCTRYFLDSSVCSDEGLNNLLRYKVMLSLQVLATVAALTLQCWQMDDLLIRYSGVLLFSPAFATSFAFVLNKDTLNQRTVWLKDVVVVFFLAWMTIPRKSHVPFITGTKQSNKTIQSLCLMVFCFVSLFEMYQWGSTLYQFGADGIAEFFFTPAFLTTLPSGAVPELATVTHFFLIDKFTIALSIFFAWFYLKEGHHRTLLFLLGATKIAVAFYQLPLLEDVMTVASSTKKNIEIGLAALGIVAWAIPSMSFKAKSS